MIVDYFGEHLRILTIPLPPHVIGIQQSTTMGPDSSPQVHIEGTIV